MSDTTPSAPKPRPKTTPAKTPPAKTSAAKAPAAKAPAAKAQPAKATPAKASTPPAPPAPPAPSAPPAPPAAAALPAAGSPYGAGPAYTAAPQPLSAADEKLWATLIHVGGILFGWLAPLIGYLVLKDRGPFIRAHSATALNFQLTLLIGYAIAFVTSFILIGGLLWLAIWVLSIIFGIMAALAANRGEYYIYPLTIKFVS